MFQATHLSTHRFRVQHVLYVSLLALFLGLLLTEAAKGAEDAADPYDTLYDVLMTRYGEDGRSYAESDGSPAIFLLSEFPFGDKTFKKFDAALDAFAALSQEKVEAYCDVQRALLQRHLWKVFDATFPIPAHWSELTEYEGKNKHQLEAKAGVLRRQPTRDRRAASQPKIASLIRRLALAEEQILGLPHTGVATTKSGGFDKRHDPDDPVKPFFPDDLYAKDSSWICLGQENDPIPGEMHSEKLKWRSTFLSFMRLPGGREETLKYLQKMSHEEPFPVGTQVALIEQAFLISDKGEMVLSPLIVSVSLRAFLDVTREADFTITLDVTRRAEDGRPDATQSVAEFVMQPRKLLQGNAVMKALKLGDPRYDAGDPDDEAGDPFEKGKVPKLKIDSRLNLCMRCHLMAGVRSILTTPDTHRLIRKGASPEAIIKATSKKKRDHHTWKKLRELWLADPLPERAIRRFGTARYRHGAYISGLAISPDDTLAVAFARRSLSGTSIYDLRDGQRLAKLSGDAVEAVAFSSDGKLLATKYDRGIKLHDPMTGVELDKIQVWTGNPRHVSLWLAFSPDGSKIAQPVAVSDVQIIDVKTKKVMHTLTHSSTVPAGVFSPDGKLFAAGERYWVRLWDVDTGKEVRRMSDSNPYLHTLAFSPDGKTLAGGGKADAGDAGEGRLRLWDVATGKVDHLFEKNGSRILSVIFSHDGKTIASAGESIVLYDATTRKERLSIPCSADNLHFSASDEVLTGSVDGAIYRWDTKTGKFLTPQGCDSGISQIALASKGRTLVVRDQAGVVHLWDRSTGEHLRQLEMDKRREFAVSPDGRFLVLSQDGNPSSQLKLFDLESGEYVPRFAKDEGTSYGKEFTRDGKTLVTIDHYKAKARTWDVATGRAGEAKSIRREDALRESYLISGSLLSPDGKILAVAYRRKNYPDGTYDRIGLRLWDVTTGKQLANLDEGHNLHGRGQADGSLIDGLAFSPDGRFLASCAEGRAGARNKTKTLFIWDVKTGQQLVQLSDKESTSAFRVAFSPDGRTLASASLDGAVRVWEVASWTLRTKLQAHRDHISALHFAPDGTLFTGSYDATVLAWNVRPDKTAKDLPLPKAWDNLLDPQAEAAYAVQGRLLATPEETVALLAGHLRPAAKVDAEKIGKLLADLDSDDFATRAATARALGEFRHQIEPALRDTLAETTSIEIRARVQELLTQLEPTVAPPTELRMLRAVEVLEWLATPSARELLAKLAEGDPNAQLTRSSASAVERLQQTRN